MKSNDLITADTQPKKLSYRIPSAAAALEVSTATLWRLIAAGELRTVRAGRAVLIPSTELERYLQAVK